MGQLGSEAPVGGSFHLFKIAHFEKHFALFTFSQDQIYKDCPKELSQNSTNFKYGKRCVFHSCQQDISLLLSIQYSAHGTTWLHIWYFSSFKHSVMWIHSLLINIHELAWNSHLEPYTFIIEGVVSVSWSTWMVNWSFVQRMSHQ